MDSRIRAIAQSPAAQSPRWLLPWLEIGLPLYAVGLVVWYYQPDRLDLALGDGWIESIVAWSVRIGCGAFGGVLALFALLLAFCLLYSPVYLSINFSRAATPGVWLDRDEFRFYLQCVGLLCLLIGLAVWNLEVALAVFVLLAGSIPLLSRLFL